jgi:hypothetical protein
MKNISIAIIVVYLICAIGWVLNLIAIADATAFSGMVVLRAVGIFIAPLGAVLGFI